MSTQNAHPLSWPGTWPRTPAHNRVQAPFHRKTGQYSSARLSMDETCRAVLNELRLVRAQQIVVSTNVELRRDGLPRSDRAQPLDVGAAVYFTLKNKPCVLACDKWKRVEDNLSAIARHIEALRAQERWGVGSVEQAFAGYTRLMAPGETGAATWYEVLGVKHDATYDQARAKYLEEAKLCHPDLNGGNSDAMIRLNAAWDQARKTFGQ